MGGNVVSITLSVPEDVKRTMEKYREINWSGFIRKCIEEKTKQLSWEDAMLKKLERDREFEQWAVEMGKKLNKSMTERKEKLR